MLNRRSFLRIVTWLASASVSVCVAAETREILRIPAKHEALKPYIQGVLRRFKDDPRILGWDLFNEPDNKNTDAYGGIELPDKAAAAQVLLEKTFAWTREVDPTQPLTAGIWLDYQGWKRNPPLYQFMLANSDIITFHNYAAADDMARQVAEMRAAFNRPILCTEYMARGKASTFDPILGDLKKARVGTFHWGLVDGKSQTIYPWDTWKKIYAGEPPLWYHDIFRADGTPYRADEVAYIRSVTKTLARKSSDCGLNGNADMISILPDERSWSLIRISRTHAVENHE